MLIGMVQRALVPGSIMRFCMMLTGPEQMGKSELVAALGGEYGGTIRAKFDLKDAQLMVRKYWVLEIPEMDSLTGVQEARIKDFLSTREDIVRPLYKNDPVTYPRRTVFFATTNEPYFLGQHENTRFLPIEVTKIDVPGLLQVREELLGEAKASLEAAPETWWQVPPEAKSFLEAERQKRQRPPAFLEDIALWLKQGFRATATTREVIETCAAFQDKVAPNTRKAVEMEIAATFKYLEWQHTRFLSSTMGRWVWGYLNPHVNAAAEQAWYQAQKEVMTQPAAAQAPVPAPLPGARLPTFARPAQMTSCQPRQPKSEV